MAMDMERLIARTAERIAALQSGATGALVFGVVSTGKYLAPYFVAAFGRAHPGIRVTLVDRQSRGNHPRPGARRI